MRTMFALRKTMVLWDNDMGVILLPNGDKSSHAAFPILLVADTFNVAQSEVFLEYILLLEAQAGGDGQPRYVVA